MAWQVHNTKVLQVGLRSHLHTRKPDKILQPNFNTIQELKHTTLLFSLFDHYILSRVIVDQVQTNHHGRPVEL